MEDIVARKDELIVKDRERLESEANLAVGIDTVQVTGSRHPKIK